VELRNITAAGEKKKRNTGLLNHSTVRLLFKRRHGLSSKPFSRCLLRPWSRNDYAHTTRCCLSCLLPKWQTHVFVHTCQLLDETVVDPKSCRSPEHQLASICACPELLDTISRSPLFTFNISEPSTLTSLRRTQTGRQQAQNYISFRYDMYVYVRRPSCVAYLQHSMDIKLEFTALSSTIAKPRGAWFLPRVSWFRLWIWEREKYACL